MAAAGKQNLNGLRKMLWRKNSFAAYFIRWNQRRRCREGYMKSTGGRLRGQERAKQGKSLGLDKN